MNNFFSQTKVVAGICIVTLILVGVIAYKLNHKNDEDYSVSKK